MIIIFYSIDKVCGVCKEGKLFPLFGGCGKTPNTLKTSRMAASKSQGLNLRFLSISNIDVMFQVRLL